MFAHTAVYLLNLNKISKIKRAAKSWKTPQALAIAYRAASLPESTLHRLLLTDALSPQARGDSGMYSAAELGPGVAGLLTCFERRSS